VQNARANVSSNRGANANRNYNANENRNVNRNVNRDVNRDINRDVDVDVHGHGCCGGDYDGWGHPVATAVAVTATAVAVGTVVSSLPSSGCSAVTLGGVGYQKCGPNYYQPSYESGGVQYVAVNPPQ
jgi:hypothetical protein